MDIRKHFRKRKNPTTPPPPAQAQAQPEPEQTPSPPRKLSAFTKLLYTPSRIVTLIENIVSKRRADLQSKGKTASGQSNPVSILDYAELGPGALDELIDRGKTAKGVCCKSGCIQRLTHLTPVPLCCR